MNVLKKFKFLFLSVLAVLLSLTVASCDKKDTPVEEKDKTEDKTEEDTRTDIADDDPSFSSAKAHISEKGFNFDTSNLSSIDIDVQNAKTTFYLGDTFSSEGVVVTANFMTSADGASKSDSFTTTDFTVDSSEVDMYNIGTYPVEVTYRYKATINKKTYNVNVISSELAVSGEEYVGGIEVLYKDNKDFSVELGSTFDATVTNFSVKSHTFVNEVEQGEGKMIGSKNYSTDGSTPVVIDASAVNTSVRGDYIVKVTYTPDEVVVGGKTINYTVKAFIIIHVVDPITKVEFVSGTTSYSATVKDLDFSDWKFKVTRKNSGVASVDYNEKDFVINGIVPFIAGNQKALVSYLDYVVTLEIPVTITESTDYNITVGNVYNVVYDEEKEANVCTGDVWKSTIATNAADEDLDASGLFKINKPSAYATDRLNSSQMSKDVYGSLYFGNRPTIKGADSYVSVRMDNPGIIVIYAASTGDGARDVNVFGGVNLSGKEVGTQYTSSTKQQITQLVFEVDEAGTYYIQSFEGGFYLHGVAVAVAK